MPDPIQQYYEYLRKAGADVPNSFSSFKNTLSDENSAKQYFGYLKSNDFDAPETFESFANTLGLKKKDVSQKPLEISGEPAAPISPSKSQLPSAPRLTYSDIEGVIAKAVNTGDALRSLRESSKGSSRLGIPGVPTSTEQFARAEAEYKSAMAEKDRILKEYAVDVNKPVENIIKRGESNLFFDGDVFDEGKARKHIEAVTAKYGGGPLLQEQMVANMRNRLVEEKTAKETKPFIDSALKKRGINMDQTVDSVFKSITQPQLDRAKQLSTDAEAKKNQLLETSKTRANELTNTFSSFVDGLNKQIEAGTMTVDQAKILFDQEKNKYQSAIKSVDNEYRSNVQKMNANLRSRYSRIDNELKKLTEGVTDSDILKRLPKEQQDAIKEAYLEGQGNYVNFKNEQRKEKDIAAGWMMPFGKFSSILSRGAASGFTGTLASFGDFLIKNGSSNDFSKWLSSFSTEQEKLAPAKYEWSQPIEKFLSITGTTLGGSAPQMLLGGLAAVIPGAQPITAAVASGVAGALSESAVEAGDEFSGALMKGKDVVVAKERADEIYKKNMSNAALYAIGGIGNYLAVGKGKVLKGFGLELAEELPLSVNQSYEKAVFDGYKKSKIEFVKENPDMLVDLFVGTIGMSAAMGGVGKLYTTITNTVPSGKTQFLQEMVQKSGSDAAKAVLDMYANNGIIDENELLESKAKVDQLVATDEKLSEAGVTGDQAKLITALGDQEKELKIKVQAEQDPAVKAVLQKQLSDLQKDVKGVIDNTTPYITFTLPGGGDMTRTMTVREFNALPQEKQDQAIKSADKIAVVNDEATNTALNEKKLQLGNQPAQDGAYTNGITGPAKAPAMKVEKPTIEERLGDEVMGDVDQKVQMAQSALQATGVKINMIDNTADFEAAVAERKGPAGVEGVFLSDTGEILINKELLAKGIADGRVVWHEASHPVINIVRNTNSPLFDKVIAGMKEAAKTDKAVDAVLNWANENYGVEGEGVVNDEAVVEMIANISEGTIDITKLPTGFKQSVIDFVNSIAKALGFNPVLSDTDVAAFKNLVTQISDALTTGRDISEVVGAENVKEYLNTVQEPGVVTGGEFKPQARLTGEPVINVYSSRDVEALPQRSLEDIYGQFEGKAVVINSDPTRVGELTLPSGKKIFMYGGPAYLSIKDNVDANVGFATTQTSKVNTWMKYVKEVFGDKPGVTIVASQAPTSILSNSYALRYVMDAISMLPKSVLRSSDFKNEFFGKDLVLLKEAFGEKAYNDFVNKYKKSDLSDPKVIDEMIAEMGYKVGDDNKPASFKARGAFVSNLVGGIADKASLKGVEGDKGYVSKKPNKFIAKQLMDRLGINAEKVMREIGEPSLVDLYMNEGNWGFAVAGFETDPNMTVESVQQGGVKHPLFNAKFPGKNPFILDGAYELNKMFTPVEITGPSGKPYTKTAAQMLAGSMYVKGQPLAEGGSFEYVRTSPVGRRIQASRGNRLAPNGKPSNLNAKQYEQVRTPEFKNWFGDWENDPENASKIVDENGEPRVVYHGTKPDARIDFFDSSKIGERTSYSKKGFYFSSDKKNASNYALGNNKSVYSLYLNIRNPYVVDYEGVGYGGGRINDRKYIDSLNKNVTIAIDNGFDGVIAKNILDTPTESYVVPQDTIVVFEPTQIKSAVANVGEFSITDKRIQASRGNRAAIFNKELSDNVINSIRTSLRRKAPDSTTLQYLDELQEAKKNDTLVTEDIVNDMLENGVTLNNIGSMLLDDGVFETPSEVRNYFNNIGGEDGVGIIAKVQASVQASVGRRDLDARLKAFAQKERELGSTDQEIEQAIRNRFPLMDQARIDEIMAPVTVAQPTVEEKLETVVQPEGEEKNRGMGKRMLGLDEDTYSKLKDEAKTYFSQPNKQTEKAAEEFMKGKSLEYMAEFVTSNPNIPGAVNVWMAAMTAKKLGTEIDAAKKAGDIDKVEMLSAARANIYNHFSAKATELGQTVQAFVSFKQDPAANQFIFNKILKQLEEKGVTGLTDAQKAEIKGMLDDVSTAAAGLPKDMAITKLSHYLGKLTPISAFDIMQAMWYAKILSGITTQSKNFFANMVNTFIEVPVVAMRMSVQTGSLQPIFYAMKGLGGGAVKGLVKAGDILKSGVTSKAEDKFFNNDNLLEYFTWSDTKLGKTFGGATGKILDFPLLFETSPRALKFVGRSLTASDALFSTANQEAVANMLAFAQAKQEGLKGNVYNRVQQILNNTKQSVVDAKAQATQEGFKPGTVQHKRRVIELVNQKRGEEIVEKAEEMGKRATLTNEPEGFTRGIYLMATKIQETMPISKVMIPFTRIVANVSEMMINFSPAGTYRALTGIKNPKFSFKFTPSGDNKLTNDQRADLFIKSMIGITALTVLANNVGDEEDDWFDITAGGPTDFAKKYELMKGGWRPYTITFKDGTKINYAEWPTAGAFSAIGNLLDVERYGNVEDPEWIDKMVIGAYGYLTAVYDKSLLKGISDFVDIFRPTGKYGAGSEDFIKRTAENTSKFAAQQAKALTLSNASQQTLKLVDEYKENPIKEAKGAEVFYRDIPIINDGLNPIIDVFGDPVTYATTERLLPWMSVTDEKKDQILAYLNRNNVFVGMAPERPMINFDNGEERKMTRQELYEYRKLAGKYAKEFLYDNISTLKEINGMENGREMMKKTVAEFASAARDRAYVELLTK